MQLTEQTAGVIVFPIAFAGVFANWTVAILIRKLPSLRNSFGRLTAAESIADAVNSTIFAFVVAPMILFDIKPLKSYSTVVGHILIDFYDISICSHLCISVNRFCSIVAPIHYSTIFSPSNTNIIILITWASVTLPSFYLYIYLDCRLFWDDAVLIFQFRNTIVCQNVVFYSGFVKTSVITILVVVIDVTTVLRVRSYKAKMSQYNSQAHHKKSRAEMNFLKQACLQAVLFVVEIFLSFVVKPRFEPSQKWPSFLFITVTWAFVHMIDGIITLTFNKEFAQFVFGSSRTRDLSINSSSNRNNNLFINTNTVMKN